MTSLRDTSIIYMTQLPFLQFAEQKQFVYWLASSTFPFPMADMQMPFVLTSTFMMLVFKTTFYSQVDSSTRKLFGFWGFDIDPLTLGRRRVINQQTFQGTVHLLLSRKVRILGNLELVKN